MVKNKFLGKEIYMQGGYEEDKQTRVLEMTNGAQMRCRKANKNMKETSDKAKGIHRLLKEMQNQKGLLTMRLWEGVKLMKPTMGTKDLEKEDD
jgi:hypothetical protein